MVKHKTLYMALVHFKNTRNYITTKGFSTILQRFEVDQRKLLTDDQGREMSAHEQLAQDAGITFYFAQPQPMGKRLQ